jgi:hypothetical protein
MDSDFGFFVLGFCTFTITLVADALIYRGDVLAGGGSIIKATIAQGEILKPVTGITGKSERRGEQDREGERLAWLDERVCGGLVLTRRLPRPVLYTDTQAT